MSEDTKPTSSQSRPGSSSASPSPDALDSLDDRSVRALTKAIIAWTEELAGFRAAINTNTNAVMQLGSRTGKMDESVMGLASRQENVILAGKLTVDAAARATESLTRSTKRLEETGEHMLQARTAIEVTIAPRWTHRALDTLWPYAEHSSRRIAMLALTSMGAGGAVIAAVRAFIDWVM